MITVDHPFLKPTCADDIVKALDLGNRNRKMNATKMNHTSSRSHAVFQIYLKQKDKTASPNAYIWEAKMSLIDLAGLETNAVADQAKETQVKCQQESTTINRSLVTLWAVLNGLAGPKTYTLINTTGVLGLAEVINTTGVLGLAEVINTTGVLGLAEVINTTGVLGLAEVINTTGVLGLAEVINTTGVLGLAEVINTTGVLGLAEVINTTGVLGLAEVINTTGVLGLAAVVVSEGQTPHAALRTGLVTGTGALLMTDMFPVGPRLTPGPRWLVVTGSPG
ncbi:hypothetical protein NHX12_005230 [Muraenolepis orangiensis]|uniref:Kinesin motor domain-containing protein n=1 Tax=Muraenolepis orangiensis TaxID=630683 RepID=A0A9Q0DUM8_9TELE|nr:hypothetical protein NHX12_005230 [Muraenolepis orangiensis]